MSFPLACCLRKLLTCFLNEQSLVPKGRIVVTIIHVVIVLVAEGSSEVMKKPLGLTPGQVEGQVADGCCFPGQVPT